MSQMTTVNTTTTLAVIQYTINKQEANTQQNHRLDAVEFAGGAMNGGSG